MPNSRLTIGLTELLGIQLNIATTGHAQIDGLLENAIRTLSAMLRKGGVNIFFYLIWVD